MGTLQQEAMMMHHGSFRVASHLRSLPAGGGATIHYHDSLPTKTYVVACRRKSLSCKRGRRDSNPQPPDRQSGYSPRKVLSDISLLLHFATGRQRVTFLHCFPFFGRQWQEMLRSAGPGPVRQLGDGLALGLVV